jgi:5'-deoxynucleotidase YfbR-like HD superfamily hydrolase
MVGDEDMVTSKNPWPAGIEDRLRAQLTFIAEADRMKTVLLASPLASVNRRENDAEHSWHLALMVLLLSEYAVDPIDVRRTLELVIIHDLIEVYAGDSPVFDDAGSSIKSLANRRQLTRSSACSQKIRLSTCANSRTSSRRMSRQKPGPQNPGTDSS